METTSETIKKALNKLYHKRQLIDENERYVRGENPYIRPFPRPGQHEPETHDNDAMVWSNGAAMTRPQRNDDNRVPVPLAKNAVSDLVGYAARPGDIQVTWMPIDEGDAAENAEADAVTEYMRGMDEYNKADLETSSLYDAVLTQGYAYELVYFDPKQSDYPQFAKLPTRDTILVYDRQIKPKLMAAYWFKDGETVEVYEPQKMSVWVRKNDEWVYDDERSAATVFKDVPVVEYCANEKRMALFQAEKGIIDSHDKLISSSVNEVDRFNALIALFPGKITPEFVAKLKEIKAIDDLGKYETWPQYLEKSLEKINEYYNNLADRLERLFHKSVKIPDMSDENFAGNASGVAIAFKLIGLEFQASMVDSYFDEGLRRRYELCQMVPGVPSAEGYTMEIKHHRNLPMDEAVKADVAMKLVAAGILSQEGALEYLPNSIVPEVMRELDRVANEAPAVDLDGVTE